MKLDIAQAQAQAQAQEMGVAYVPIDLYGKRMETVAKGPTYDLPVDQQVVEPCLSIWCCFLTPQDERLWAGYASIPNCHRTTTINWNALHLVDVTHHRRGRSLFETREALVDEKTRASMSRIEGDWCIKPGNGKVIDSNSLVSINRDELCLITKHINGVERPAVTRKSLNHSQITRRLTEANPAVDSWFF